MFLDLENKNEVNQLIKLIAKNDVFLIEKIFCNSNEKAVRR